MTAKPLVLASSRAEADARGAIADGRRPRLDYLVLADRLGADLLDTGVSAEMPPWQRWVERALASDLRQARVAWQRRGLYGGFVSLSEKVGLPLAFRTRGRVPHVLLGHNLTSARKRLLHRQTGILRSGFSAVVCLSRRQEEFLRDEAGLPPERVYRLTHNVDDLFFRPVAQADPAAGEYLLAVGREMRDYPTLVEAARRVGLPVTIVASSLWSTRASSVTAVELPANVSVRADFVSYPGLRALYQGARAVVVPLQEADYAAGSTGVLEGMAMGKATVVTRTRGIADYVRDGVTNVTTAPGDAAALAEALERVWEDAPLRTRLGAAARARVVAEMGMDGYAARMADIVRGALGEAA